MEESVLKVFVKSAAPILHASYNLKLTSSFIMAFIIQSCFLMIDYLSQSLSKSIYLTNILINLLVIYFFI